VLYFEAQVTITQHGVTSEKNESCAASLWAT